MTTPHTLYNTVSLEEIDNAREEWLKKVGRSGRPPRDPMPRFHMTRADAEAVLAYLKSLNPGQ